MKIAISNGHGLKTAGKRTPPFPNTGQVIHEWQFNHATAKILEKILKKQGYEVLMVSDTPDDTSLTKRINMANNARCDMYMSIHYNAYQSKWGSHGGIETLYNPRSENAKKLSKLIQNELIKITGLRDRGVKPRTDLGELNNTKMVAALAECGFMDNLNEAKLMLDKGYQTKCANAIANGINAYFGKNANTSTIIANNKTKFNLNGKLVEVDGFLENGSTYVIARDLLEGLGFVVGWDNNTKSVTVNNKPINFDKKIIDGRTYAVARPLLEKLGFRVGFDAPSKTVIVSK